ncbi:MAG: HAD family phosphatase [Rubrobacteraceae bacterium]
MLKALLLDLDGTLAETDSIHRLTWATVLEPHDIEVNEEFYKENISGRLNPDVVEDLLPHVSEEQGREIAEAKEVDFRNRTDELEPLPGLMHFIEEARENGLRLALVTNAPEENVPAVLKGIGLEDAFDAIILAAEVGAGKPDPAPYLAALKDFGLSPDETIAFEDSSSGIASAVGAGIPTVGIASTHDPQKLRAAGAFMVCDDFTDPECVALLSG